MVFLQILIPSKPRQALPKVTSGKNGSIIWSTIKEEGRSDTLMVQARSGAAAFQGLETDGTFCWVREEADRITAIAVREGTYLRKGGVVLFESDRPGSAAKQFTGE